MNIVEQNGGLRNTLAMEWHDVGYKQLTGAQKQAIDKHIDELGVCPTCGEQPTYQTPDGAFWDSWGHCWVRVKSMRL